MTTANLHGEAAGTQQKNSKGIVKGENTGKTKKTAEINNGLDGEKKTNSPEKSATLALKKKKREKGTGGELSNYSLGIGEA